MGEDVHKRPLMMPPRVGWFRKLLTDVFFSIKSEKKWWLLPFIFVLLALAGLLVFVTLTGPLAPFIYPLL
jgi:hypothetical protein